MSWLTKVLGLQRFRHEIVTEQQRNQEEIMAKLQQVLDAIESSGEKIIAKINAEQIEFKAAIEEAKASGSEADLDAVLDRFNKFSSTIGDAVVGLVPTVASPVVATAPDAPVEVPPIAVVTVPNVEIPVTLTESPAEVGVDGGVSIDPV